MSVKLERIVKTFYDNLDAGRITGRRCKTCGAVEFPPFLACNTCGSTDMEWVEISGKGMMHTIIIPPATSAMAPIKELEPYCYSCVTIEEGAELNAIVCGVSKKNRGALEERLPLPVKAKIVQREEYKTIAFELMEE